MTLGPHPTLLPRVIFTASLQSRMRPGVSLKPISEERLRTNEGKSMDSHVFWFSLCATPSVLWMLVPSSLDPQLALQKPVSSEPVALTALPPKSYTIGHLTQAGLTRFPVLGI